MKEKVFSFLSLLVSYNKTVCVSSVLGTTYLERICKYVVYDVMAPVCSPSIGKPEAGGLSRDLGDLKFLDS